MYNAAKLVGGSWVGVDFIPGKTNKDLPYILEVNSSPGTKGIEQPTKINVVKTLLESYKDKKIAEKSFFVWFMKLLNMIY